MLTPMASMLVSAEPTEVVESKVQTVYQWFAYCLYRDYHIHKAIMLKGEGRNGKSTLLNLLDAFLGEDAITHIDLQSLCNNRFATAELRGKFANIYDDLKYNALADTGNFKILTGDGPSGGEIKFVQRRISFHNYAKLIFSTNKFPPNMHDDTDAFWRRWIILQFQNTFDGATHPCEIDLIHTLTLPDELEGLLYKCVSILFELVQHGKFSFEQDVEEVKKSWTRDTIKDFVRDCVILDLNSAEPKRTVYEAYKNYAIANSGILFDERVFGMKFKTEVAVRDGQREFNGVRNIHCYVGMRLKTQDTQTQIGGQTLL